MAPLSSKELDLSEIFKPSHKNVPAICFLLMCLFILADLDELLFNSHGNYNKFIYTSAVSDKCSIATASPVILVFFLH